MRFQILSLLIIVSFINCDNTFKFVSKTEGSCADNIYTFTVTGTVATATASTTTGLQHFLPLLILQLCSMPAVGTDGGSGTITCKITSALSNSAITLTV